MTPEQQRNIEKYSSQERCKYLLKEVIRNKELWLLADEHGCMMLNTQDEDCVPIWPNEAFAQAWATGEWKNCKPEAISLHIWHSRWTDGLAEDELALVIFPNQTDEGIILHPDEFDFELKAQAKKPIKAK